METKLGTKELDWAKLSRIARKLARKNEDVAQTMLFHVLGKKPQTEEHAIALLGQYRTLAWRAEKQAKTIGEVLTLADAAQDDGKQYRHGVCEEHVRFILAHCEDADGKLSDRATITRIHRRVMEFKPSSTYKEISALLRKIEANATEELQPEPAGIIGLVQFTPHKIKTYQERPVRLPRQERTELAGRWTARQRTANGIQTGWQNVTVRNWTSDKPAPTIELASNTPHLRFASWGADKDSPDYL